MKITSKTKLDKILKMKDGEEILHKNNVPCISCPMAPMEIDKLEIGQICKAYKLDLKKILKELNHE